MHDRPDPATLIATAQKELVNKLLPTLSPEHRHVALNISRALGIVERSMSSSDPISRAALQRLRLMADHLPELNATLDAHADRPMHAQLQAADETLKRAIRDDHFSTPERQRELFLHLATSAEDRLRVNNPQRLY